MPETYNALPDARRKEILETFRRTRSVKETARICGCHDDTARKYGRDAFNKAEGGKPATIAPQVVPQATHFLPEPAPEAGGPRLPDPVELSYEPYIIDNPGLTGILSDVHLPYHDKKTIEKWADECRDRNAQTILLNGDILDCYQLSSHFKEPDKGRFRDEVDCAKAFFAWLRAKFPKARIVYKEGNHDERLRRYLAERAPALFDIKEFDLRTIIGLDGFGVEWINRKRVVRVGKLAVVHGHEFKGSGGVMPARWLFLRTGATALCGHFHQSSYYTFRTLDQKEIGVWSVGCACFLSPDWLPVNQWSNGWAMVDVAQNGEFHVDNRRLLRSGQVV